MTEIRKMDFMSEIPRTELLLKREWLVTNGMGGYASGTVSGALTRRYHGLLIAAYPTPLGRMVVLNKLSELVRLPDGSVILFGGSEKGDGSVELYGVDFLQEFELEDGLPVWRYKINDTVIEKRVYLLHMQNTVHINYKVIQGEENVRLKLQPAINFRSHDAPVTEGPGQPYVFSAVTNRYQISAGGKMPQLRFVLEGERASFTLAESRQANLFYRIEYNPIGELWSPGYFAADISKGRDATLIASTETWEAINTLSPSEALHAEQERRRRLIAAADPRARKGLPAELVVAADQFIIWPAGRVEDKVRAHAMGDEIRTIIAGYHWFTDWGRDTMISLEGLTLATGRHSEAGLILRTFAHYVKDGLIPNMFPEGKSGVLEKN